jgi:hypothetical protein
MLEELEAEYDIRRYERRVDMRAPEELKKVHPLGKSPVIEDVVDGHRTVLSKLARSANISLTDLVAFLAHWMEQMASADTSNFYITLKVR